VTEALTAIVTVFDGVIGVLLSCVFGGYCAILIIYSVRAVLFRD
jgi:hypothetical protein